MSGKPRKALLKAISRFQRRGKRAPSANSHDRALVVAILRDCEVYHRNMGKMPPEFIDADSPGSVTVSALVREEPDEEEEEDEEDEEESEDDGDYDGYSE